MDVNLEILHFWDEKLSCCGIGLTASATKLPLAELRTEPTMDCFAAKMIPLLWERKNGLFCNGELSQEGFFLRIEALFKLLFTLLWWTIIREVLSDFSLKNQNGTHTF